MSNRRNDDLKERMKALRVNEPLKLKNEGLAFKPPVQMEAPRNEVPHFQSAPQVIPQSEKARNEVVCSEAPQKEVAQLETARRGAAQNDPPQNESAQKEVSGFFKLSHRVFSEPSLRDLSGDCFRLFLWLSSRAWRYPTSDGMVRASVGFIETNTGMPHATISRALKTLKDKSLVSIVQVDFKKGNVWRICPVACSGPMSGGDPEDKQTQKKVPQSEAAQSGVQAASKRDGTQLAVRQLPPQIEQDLRSIKKIKNKKEPSSPPILLSVAPTDPEIGIEERLAALEAFEKALDDGEKEQVLQGFTSREYPHGYFPPGKVVRMLAATEWYQNRDDASCVFAG